MMPFRANCTVFHTAARCTRVVASRRPLSSTWLIVMPAAARMPEAWARSASRYAPKGISRLIRVGEPASWPKCRDNQRWTKLTASANATPAGID